MLIMVHVYSNVCNSGFRFLETFRVTLTINSIFTII